MPSFNGSGPEGAGSMTGRGMGRCGGVRAQGSVHGRGRGFGSGHGVGCGRGFGPGRSRGTSWLSAGYGAGGGPAAATTMKVALEERRAFLRAELARTEALLGEPNTDGGAGTDEGAGN